MGGCSTSLTVVKWATRRAKEDHRDEDSDHDADREVVGQYDDRDCGQHDGRLAARHPA
ncbi:hypothetical protein [Kribbella caucasensis]|uniref:hypothetical protein n=1 Tax=Kribbella caucasensis TaxID=2512215 RepID=UPI001414DDE2|nr:hypothetical protein [Kribbella sp. VKM Ac-2527]